MQLRRWQQECVDAALDHYTVHSHFLCLATPGAGKTVMSASIAAALVAEGKVDYVLCFAPSIEVAGGLQAAFSRCLGRRFDGLLGALGGAYTYQSLQMLGEDFWELFDHHKVLVVFDEIHHCAGAEGVAGNAWGRVILEYIENRARYTLALSGTPWRSDGAPITLSHYHNEQDIHCDYVYGLRDAIDEGVCRRPQIVLVDNAQIHLTNTDGDQEAFDGFKELLATPRVSYQSILNHEQLASHVLGLGVAKLECIRAENPAAGGLVVASSVAHAHCLASVLANTYGQTVVVVTHQTPKAQRIIESFRESSTQWIVSVGMVSEGTDIPRLQVCCHLSWIRTELYFRQVLGRVLRVNGSRNQDAWLYTLAEPCLAEYAHRVDHDLPEYSVVSRALGGDSVEISHETTIEPFMVNDISDRGIQEWTKNELDLDFANANSYLTQSASFYSDPISIELLGQYRQQVIDIFDCAGA